MANWKMALRTDQAVSLARRLIRQRSIGVSPEVVLCPSFPALSAVQAAVSKTHLQLGAQDVSWTDRGALTGDVMPDDLRWNGCRYVIVGHSERRRYQAESNQTIGKKVTAALSHGLSPIVCVGETAEERRRRIHHHVVARQLEVILKSVPPARHGQHLLVAYEPIWAISPGGPAEPADAFEMAQVIRQALVDQYGGRVAGLVRILYGGSVSAANVRDFIDHQAIEGVLVGSESQQAETFIALLKALE